MTIVALGFNYRTVPVEVRDKLAIIGESQSKALKALQTTTPPASGVEQDVVPVIQEAAIVSTCNRLEIYVSTFDTNASITAVERILSQLLHIAVNELAKFGTRFVGDSAVLHLMRVSCGLDSAILGESQILGQVTQASENAHAQGATGPILSHLFALAIHAGKRARTETEISHYTTSVSHVSANLIKETLEHDQPIILIVGAGEMAVLAAQALRRTQTVDLTFINRTYSRALELAREFDGEAIEWDELPDALRLADAVICATSAPHTIIFRHDVESILDQRDNRRLILMDIAVPRDIDDTVRELPNVQYYDIDDLQTVVDTNTDFRKAAIPHVEVIIQQETVRFEEWYRGRQVTPVIKDLREWAQNIADDELIQTLNRLSDADEHTREMVSRMAHRLVNRLLHEPTSRLKLRAKEGNSYGYAYAIRELFALKNIDDADSTCILDRIAVGSTCCDLHCLYADSTDQKAHTL